MGNKRGHKGGRRQFTNPQAIEAQRLKEEKEREWRRNRGEQVSDDEEEESDEEDSSSEQEESEESEESEEEDPILAVHNPNRMPAKTVNKREVNTLAKGVAKVELSRREREELAKQKPRTVRGEEAHADLARLAIIRKKREEAAKKREQETKAAAVVEKAGTSKSK